MNSSFTHVSLLRVNLREKTAEEKNEPVAREVPVKIYANNIHAITLFASPNHLKELGIGWLLGQGVVKSIDEIEDVKVKGTTVKVTCAGRIGVRLKAAKTLKIMDTACGSTPDDYQVLLDRVSVPKIKSEYKVEAEELLRFVKILNQKSKIFRNTGGTHSAAIFENGILKAFTEDIGRHNAVDKAIGIAALKKTDFSSCVLVSSGRQPANMVLKAARTGIPIVASIAGPIDSGVKAARKTGVTLVCFVRGHRMNIYSRRERIII